MKLRDLIYVISPLADVVIYERDYENESFDNWEILFGGTWYKCHGVPFDSEVLDLSTCYYEYSNRLSIEIERSEK